MIKKETNLDSLIAQARTVTISADQREKQRRSFAYGNAKIENARISRQSIDAEAAALSTGSGKKTQVRSPSRFEFPTLSEEEKARIESRNALRQFDLGMQVVLESLEKTTAGDRFVLSPSLIERLNGAATVDTINLPGEVRDTPIGISHSAHQCPDHDKVGPLLQELCDYVNGNWARSAIHLASFVLWRLNWIHPFPDGNGRTARMVSYIVLSVRLGFELPGTRTIPSQIATNKQPYYRCLEAADAHWKVGRVDVEALEELLTIALAGQLSSVIEEAISDGTAATK